jgi:uncharacterized Tic20 family protein
MNTSPASDEKIIAALAHGSVLFAFLGPIVPVIVWASQRKKSKYVCFHALQAMGYQALMFWLWIVVMILIIALSIFLAFPLSVFITENSHDAMFAPFVIQMFIFISIFGLMGLFFLTGIIGAVYCLLGRDFRYPFLGKRLERYLSYTPDLESQIDETKEDNWVAGICHATAALQLWGAITPLIVWFSQKERSARLRFQAMQAFVYQLTALVAYMAGMALYMFSFFGMVFIPLAGAALNGGKEIPAPAGILMLVFLGLIMIFWLIFMLLLPVYYLLAGFASIRVIQGRPFRYPIPGKVLEKRMQISQNLEAVP